MSKALVLALFLSQSSAKKVILDPPAGSGDKPLAVIWIHGMQCEPEAYQTLAEEFQRDAGNSGYKAWVGIPEFIFDAPEPVLIDHYVEQTIKDLKEHGFTGDDIFIAAHSLGGVMSQKYVKSHSNLIKG